MRLSALRKRSRDSDGRAMGCSCNSSGRCRRLRQTQRLRSGTIELANIPEQDPPQAGQAEPSLNRSLCKSQRLSSGLRPADPTRSMRAFWHHRQTVVEFDYSIARQTDRDLVPFLSRPPSEWSPPKQRSTLNIQARKPSVLAFRVILSQQRYADRLAFMQWALTILNGRIIFSAIVRQRWQ